MCLLISLECQFPHRNVVLLFDDFFDELKFDVEGELPFQNELMHTFCEMQVHLVEMVR